jgi:hypothetical protein
VECYRLETNSVSVLSREIKACVVALLESLLTIFFSFTVAIDDEDVTRMVVSEITTLMSSKSTKERRLTVITTSNSNRVTSASEEKYDEPL